MKPVETLIDEAVKKCQPQTQAELARRIGASRGNVNDWMARKRPMPAWAYKAVAEVITDRDTARNWLYEFVDAVKEKISTPFNSLLRRGMAVRSRAYVLA